MAPKKTVVRTTKKTIRESIQVLIDQNTKTETPVKKAVTSNEKIEVYTFKTPQEEPETLEEDNDDDDTQLAEEENRIEKFEDAGKGREKKEIKVQGTEKQEQPKKTKFKTESKTKPAASKTNGRRKRRRTVGEGGGEGYKRYLYRVLKQVHPDLAISSKTMTIISNMMGDMFERLAEAAGRLSDYNKKMTLSGREIQAAVKLVVPGELGKHAVAEGSKAVSSYLAYGGGDGGGRK